VTMCDVGGGGERLCDITHVTFAAKFGTWPESRRW